MEIVKGSLQFLSVFQHPNCLWVVPSSRLLLPLEDQVQALVAHYKTHDRDFMQSKTTFLLVQGDADLATALEEEGDSCIVFFIATSPENDIISDAKDSFKIF